MKKGFTLVEIMIVIAIIALLSAMAILNLIRARAAATESTAASALHIIIASQAGYRGGNALYATLAQLGAATPPYIDAALAAGSNQGYTFTDAMVPTASQWVVEAVPGALTQGKSYYVDEDGFICRSDNVSQAAGGAHVATTCPANYSAIQ